MTHIDTGSSLLNFVQARRPLPGDPLIIANENLIIKMWSHETALNAIMTNMFRISYMMYPVDSLIPVNMYSHIESGFIWYVST